MFLTALYILDVQDVEQLTKLAFGGDFSMNFSLMFKWLTPKRIMPWIYQLNQFLAWKT